MKILNEYQPGHDLTYADVFLSPVFSDVESRSDVDLTTPDGVGTTLPIVVANMTAVAGRRMAETVARRGGLAVFPQDVDVEAIADMTSAVKNADTVFDTPITLEETETVNSALDLINKRAHGAAVIVDEAGRPTGIFVESDGYRVDRFTPLSYVMTPDPVVIPHTMSPRDMFEFLASRRVHLAPVVDDDGRLVGLITEDGAMRSTVYEPAVDDDGRLMVAAAIGVSGDAGNKAAALIETGVDVIVVDTAHGHQGRMLETLRAVREAAPDHSLVAGNVVTPQGVRDLVDAGADIVKVGVGPGAMCTTRMMTGVGRPQFSAVVECASEARSMGRHVWADGGVRYPRDVALALAAGASSVMIGSWFAGTYESAADFLKDSEGRSYKENYGMASKRAVSVRTSYEGVYARALKARFDEGISESRMYLDPEMPSVEDIIDRIVSGVQSACTYTGARSIDELHQRAVVGIQSATGFSEGRPLDESW